MRDDVHHEASQGGYQPKPYGKLAVIVIGVTLFFVCVALAVRSCA